MSRTIDAALSAHTFGMELEDNDQVSDVLILARVINLNDGVGRFVMCGNDGLDAVVRAGLISVARQLDEGGWVDIEEDDE